MPSIFSTDLIVENGQSKVPSKYTVYTERWYLLLVAMLLNFSFGSVSFDKISFTLEIRDLVVYDFTASSECCT